MAKRKRKPKAKKPGTALVRIPPPPPQHDAGQEDNGTRPGRPPFFRDLRKRDVFLGALNGSNTVDDAAFMAQVDPSTVYRCLKRGKKAHWIYERGDALDERENEFRDFYQATRLAMAASKVGHVNVVHRAAAVDWRAALKILERRFPQEWALVRLLPEETTDAALPEFRVHRLREPRYPPPNKDAERVDDDDAPPPRTVGEARRARGRKS